jgi:hypothetical protein
VKYFIREWENKTGGIMVSSLWAVAHFRIHAKFQSGKKILRTVTTRDEGAFPNRQLRYHP